MQGEHAEHQHIARSEMGGQDARAALAGQGTEILVQVRAAGGVPRNIKTAHGIYEVAETVRSFDHHQRPIHRRHVAQRNPGGVDTFVVTREVRTIEVQTGRAAACCRSQRDEV